MSGLAKAVLGRFYRKADGNPERLPWHQESPPEILVKAVAALERRGRALDVGCGAGVFSVWLAKQGFDVTGIDLFPEAIAMAATLAKKNEVDVHLVTGDLFTWSAEQPFDLVFDSACLQALVGGHVPAYKQQLMRWLNVGGTYVLGHWGKRHAFDWRPIGPKRRTEKAIREIFAPELQLLGTDFQDFVVPLPFGPTARGIGYWFRRDR